MRNGALKNECANAIEMLSPFSLKYKILNRSVRKVWF